MKKENVMAESLEDAAFKYANKNIKPNYCMDDFEIPFKDGANWQQQKDKATIDKLIEALKTLKAAYEYFSKFGFDWEGRNTSLGQFVLVDMKNRIEDNEQLLQQIESEKK